MKNDFVSSARSVSEMKAHLVRTIKDRRKVLDGKVIARLHDIFDDLCEKWDCKFIEFNGESDHVHILFQYYPKIYVLKFINRIRSVFIGHIRAEFAKVIDAVCWKAILPKIRRHPKIIARQCFAPAHTPLIPWLRQRSATTAHPCG